LDLAGHNQSPERERGVSIDSAGGIGGLLATEDVAGSKDYLYLYDANGNVGQVLDASDGSIAAKYEYDAYGNNLLDPTDEQESGPYAADNPFRFSTKYWDDETGLGYWGHRYYSPRLGRWMKRDPASEAGGITLYLFVANRPVNAIDPYGLWGKEMHHDATYRLAIAVGMKAKCAKIVANANWNVDKWAGASLSAQYHFDYDVNGKKFSCGRSCWFGTRWKEGTDLLTNCTWNSVEAGLKKIGQALHSMQDGSSHSGGHDALTPFDHAPSVFCALWGDPFGIIWPRCREARETSLNWPRLGVPDTGPERPDKKKVYRIDFIATEAATLQLLDRVVGYESVRCLCRQSSGRRGG
ncbi:MAG: RHS repeat-associated core domain-containing protein, partial [Planctomycetes bacterium]|nr:RHS repeat-associated core domain-containing protein [Planctomycetota bacterium]